MKTRDLFIIVLALVVSIIVAIATRYILRGGSDSAESVKVMVAASDLLVGKRLEKSSFRWQEWPKGTLQPTYITDKNKEVAEKLVGTLIRQHMAAGEPVLKSNLAGEKSGFLSAMINENLRAFTIPLDNRSNISGKVLPEDFVDVIVARKDTESKEYVANTVVRKVRVLEINGNLDPTKAEDEAKAKAQSITLEVSPRQAELLAASLREGSPVISLHSMTSDDKPEPVEEKKEVVKEVKQEVVAPQNENNKVDVIRRSEIQTVEIQG